MVRAPCCEKMGLKRGPWTIEEDHILISFIQKHGHPNWRALPKHAGLLRCGKSCRLRWTNYLRPDIKRGNFSKEEEDMIISLHERIGNRWSAIAAKLPGRTDNEIKNVWHTYLKKHIQPNQESSKPKKAKSGSKTVKLQKSNVDMQANSSELSFNSEISSTSGTSNSSVTTVTTDQNNKSFGIQNESMDFSSQLDFEVLDESTWSEALSIMEGENGTVAHTFGHISEQLSLICSSNDEEIDYWLRIFREAGDLHNLPEL